MIKIDEKNIILEENELNKKISYINISDNPNFKYKKLKNNTVFFANLNSNYESICQTLNNISKAIDFGIKFGVKYDNYNLLGIITNSNEKIIQVFKAIFIKDLKERFNFIYNIAMNEAEKFVKENNHCDFQNNICINYRENKKYKKYENRPNGCCSANFRLSVFLARPIHIHECEHLQNGKCKEENLACKIFFCNYLKKKFKLEYSVNNIMILKSLLNKKQLLILEHNFFIKKDVLIEHLLKKDNLPFFLYNFFSKYSLLYDKKKLF